MLSSSDYPNQLAASYYAWWQDAGVDYVCGEDVMNWLKPELKGETLPTPAAPILQRQVPTKADTPKAVPAVWPADIATLKAAIAQGAALPGCGYGSRCVPPTGERAASAFILVDCPEEEEVAAGSYGHGASAALLNNMLLAAKILPDFTYQTALAHSRSAANSIPKSDLPLLADFVRHQIKLVEPKVILVFGAAACEAMLGQDLMKARGILQDINYNDRKTAAVVTFHPRTLIAQPRMKAKAWQDLQMLARKDYL